MSAWALFSSLLFAGTSTVAEDLDAQEPSLPAGLEAPETQIEGEPPLPEGMEEDRGSQTSVVSNQPAWWKSGAFGGFFELRSGTRLVEDPGEAPTQIGELRLQVRAEEVWDWGAAGVTTDFLYDPVINDHAVNLETGDGAIDLRNAYLLLSPTDFADLKIGRQVLTWGTGDLAFINDLFPKDWNSLLAGRDVEYLKAPSDAAKLVLASSSASLDLVFVPVFDSDRFPDRRRLSSLNRHSGQSRARRHQSLQIDPIDGFETGRSRRASMDASDRPNGHSMGTLASGRAPPALIQALALLFTRRCPCMGPACGGHFSEALEILKGATTILAKIETEMTHGFRIPRFVFSPDTSTIWRRISPSEPSGWSPIFATTTRIPKTHRPARRRFHRSAM